MITVIEISSYMQRRVHETFTKKPLLSTKNIILALFQ